MKHKSEKINLSQQDSRPALSFVLIVFSLLLLQIFLPHVSHADVVVTTKTDKPQVAVGEKLEVTVAMEWEQSEGNDIFVVKVDPPSSKSLELLNSKESTSSKLTQKGIMGSRLLHYTFKAKEAGQAVIDPVLIEYITSPEQKDPTIKRGESVQVMVISRGAGIFKKIALILGVGIGLLFITGVPIFLWKRGAFRSKPKGTGSAAGFFLERNKLAKLKDVRMYQVSGDIALLYSEVEQILTDYFEAKYKVSVRGKTESDLENTAKSISIPDELMRLFLSTVHTSEQVRFGGAYPNKDEQEKFLRAVETYFRSLIPKMDEEETIETVD